MWDTAGQEMYKSLCPTYIKDADGVLLVCDVSRKETYFGLSDWAKIVRDHAPAKVVTAIVGNKIDVSPQEIQVS